MRWPSTGLLNTQSIRPLDCFRVLQHRVIFRRPNRISPHHSSGDQSAVLAVAPQTRNFAVRHRGEGIVEQAGKRHVFTFHTNAKHNRLNQAF